MHCVHCVLHGYATYCLLPTAYCLLPTAYCLLPTAYYLLPTTYCLLLSSLLPTPYSLLPTAYLLTQIVQQCEAAGAHLFVDEMYRGLEHGACV